MSAYHHSCRHCGAPFQSKHKTATGCSRSCAAHLIAARRTVLSPAERLWRRVDRHGPTVRSELGPCWIWTGARDKQSGYGRIGSGVSRNATESTHRVSWEVTNGPIPAGLHVLHKCDNPPCCNPAHLFVGTPHDNVHDMKTKGRAVGKQLGGHTYRKITAEAHAEIGRSMSVPRRELAARFGVNVSKISRIWREHRMGGRNDAAAGTVAGH